MKPAFSLRVYILRRGRAADSFVGEVRKRFYRIIWKKMESMESADPVREQLRSYYDSDMFLSRLRISFPSAAGKNYHDSTSDSLAVPQLQSKSLGCCIHHWLASRKLETVWQKYDVPCRRGCRSHRSEA